MLKGAMVQYQTRNDGTAKNTHSQSSMKQQPARAQFCCSLPSFSSYISPTSLVESEKISMAASSLWAHWVGQICPCTSRKIEATNADALGRSWRTSRPKQLPVYQKKNYMEIGRPIPASSWSRVLQFAGRDASGSMSFKDSSALWRNLKSSTITTNLTCRLSSTSEARKQQLHCNRVCTY